MVFFVSPVVPILLFCRTNVLVIVSRSVFDAENGGGLRFTLRLKSIPRHFGGWVFRLCRLQAGSFCLRTCPKFFLHISHNPVCLIANSVEVIVLLP